jgi:hypothetical protein
MSEQRRANRFFKHISACHIPVNNAERNPERKKPPPDMPTFLPKWQSAAICAPAAPPRHAGPATCLHDRSPFTTTVYDRRPRCAWATTNPEGGAHLLARRFFRFQTGPIGSNEARVLQTLPNSLRKRPQRHCQGALKSIISLPSSLTVTNWTRTRPTAD